MKRILVTHNEGLAYVETPRGSASGRTIESALGKIAPDAPMDKVAHCAEILEGLMGPAEHSQVHTGVVDA